MDPAHGNTIAPRPRKPRALLGLTTPNLPEARWQQLLQCSLPESRSVAAGNFSSIHDRLALKAVEVTACPSAIEPYWSDCRSSPQLKPLSAKLSVAEHTELPLHKLRS